MSTLIPAVQVLDKGLNLQTAKIIAPPGSVLDSLNYEQVDFQGQKRIDGYVNYDGKPSGIEDNIRLISMDSEDAGEFVVDDSIVRIDGVVVGQVVNEESDYDAGVGYYVVMVDNFRALSRISGVLTISEAEFIDDADVVQKYRDHADAAASNIEGLPGQVNGLHWFGDKLYALADVPVIELTSPDYDIVPGDTVNIDGVDFEVLGSYKDGSKFLVTIASWYVEVWKQYGVDTAYVRPYNSSDEYTATISGYSPAVPEDRYLSSFFEALTHQQARDETDEEYPYGGWKFCHHGWLLDFHSGASAFGDFPSVNQNLQGLGIQGPTSTGNGSGSPTVLTQSVSIDGAQEQVSGWKSSSETTAYTPRPSDIMEEGDGSFIYADAFVSWENGVITSPSHTDTLVEYTANNTVEVDV